MKILHAISPFLTDPVFAGFGETPRGFLQLHGGGGAELCSAGEAKWLPFGPVLCLSHFDVY